MFFFYFSARPFELRLGRLPSEGLYVDSACVRCIQSLRDEFRGRMVREHFSQCQATNFSHVRTQTPPVDKIDPECMNCERRPEMDPSVAWTDPRDARLSSYGKRNSSLDGTLTNSRKMKTTSQIAKKHYLYILQLPYQHDRSMIKGTGIEARRTSSANNISIWAERLR